MQFRRELQQFIVQLLSRSNSRLSSEGAVNSEVAIPKLMNCP
jgi:hypothetical protein